LAKKERSSEKTMKTLEQHSGSQSSFVVAFLIGTAVGGVAGAAVATLLSPYTAATLSSAYASIARNLPGKDDVKPKFELLLQ
jgi:Na+-driven multidrug efflux pump